MEIIDQLENFEFHEFDIADLDDRGRINLLRTLGLYGYYCMHNRIKFLDTQNKHNTSLHFVSEATGKKLAFEIRHRGLVERVERKYNRFCDSYEAAEAGADFYKLICREETNPATV